ncbi:hypothetical protein NQ314_009012 [Rhamnusium bicolor]|uniref:Uncharacterized protein n=1 Tax=Rhamnusium bicolor TaxID=1586634 RepID=A0AAV8Y4T9_9CUCU|nr:hypothetical protein NQ314_009012 [Rhamnusium bicolor]
MTNNISNDEIFALLKEVSAQNSNIVQQNNEIKNDIEGIENETYKDVLSLINNKFKIACTEKDIRDAYRIGKKDKEAIRPLVVELLSYNLKSQILCNAKDSLKNSGIYITQDHTQEDYQKRKFLYGQLKIAREKGCSAKIKNNILVVNDKNYKYEDLIKETNTEEITSYDTLRTNSTPNTPSLGVSPTNATVAEREKNETRTKQAVRRPEKTIGATSKINTKLRSSNRNLAGQYQNQNKTPRR